MQQEAAVKMPKVTLRMWPSTVLLCLLLLFCLVLSFRLLGLWPPRLRTTSPESLPLSPSFRLCRLRLQTSVLLRLLRSELLATLPDYFYPRLHLQCVVETQAVSILPATSRTISPAVWATTLMVSMPLETAAS